MVSISIRWVVASAAIILADASDVMEAEMLSDLETFTALFNSLKKEVNDSPATLAWLSEQKSDVRRLAYLVGDIAEKIKKTKATSTERYLVAPTGFATAWKRFESQFAAPIKDIFVAEKKVVVDNFLGEIEKIAAQKGVSKDSILEKIYQEVASYRELGDSFDPISDNPVPLINEIFHMYESIVEQDLLDEGDVGLGDKAVGAWRFFDKTIGMDHQSIYDRWKRIPELLIPAHALRVNSRPIIELYNEAVRCYVFGNKVSAIAMCRALLEHILKKHYKIDADDLDKTITMAEARYSHFKKMKLHDKRKLANEIMHRYEKHSEVEDRVVIEFLKTIQTIVQQIPRDA